MLWCTVLFAEWLYPTNDQIRLRQNTEVVGQPLVDEVEIRRRIDEITLASFVRVRILEAFVFPQVSEERLQITVESDLLFDYVHLRLDTSHFCEADVVDLLGGKVGRRGGVQPVLIVVEPVRQARNTVRDGAYEVDVGV